MTVQHPVVGEQAPERRPVEFTLYGPPELEPGVYANHLSVWHSPHEFTLDFAATQRPRAADPDDPDSPQVITCRIVARIKMPVTVAFDTIRVLNDDMTRYEQSFGEIRRPGGEP